MGWLKFRRVIGTGITLFLFLILGSFFIFSKSIDLNMQPGLLIDGKPLQEQKLAGIMDTNLPASQRIGVGIAYTIVEAPIKLLSRLVLDNPTTASFFPGTGWGFGNGFSGGFRLGYISTVVVPLLSSLIWKLLALVPIYLIAQRVYNNSLTQSIYIFIVMSSLVGWPDLILNSY